MPKQGTVVSLTNAGAIAGEQIEPNRMVAVGAAGRFEQTNPSVPMGVSLNGATPDQAFSFALPGQIVQIEASDEGEAGQPVRAAPDGRASFSTREGMIAGIALEDSAGEGALPSIWFFPMPSTVS